MIDLTSRDIYADHSSVMTGLQEPGMKTFTQPQELSCRNFRIIEFKKATSKHS